MNSRLVAFVALLSFACSSLATPVQLDDPVVHVTKSGKKYHRATCKVLLRSKIRIGMRRSEAKLKKFKPCKVCKPG